MNKKIKSLLDSIFSSFEFQIGALVITSFLLVGLISRLTLTFLNHSLSNINVDFFKALWLGMRFDLSVASYVLILILLLQLALYFLKYIAPQFPFSKGRSIIFFVLSCLFLLNTFIHVVDIGYFLYFKDRLNLFLFGFLEDDTWALIKTIWKDYPVFWMLIFIFSLQWIYIFFINRVLRFPGPSLFYGKAKVHHVAIGTFLAFIIFGASARGSLGLFPLGDLDTVISKNEFYNLLGFNSVHAMAKAVRLKSEQKSKWNSNLLHYGYGTNSSQAIADLAPFYKSVNSSSNLTLDDVVLQKSQPIQNRSTPSHLVLVVMESFGTYGLREQSPSFNLLGQLKTHFDEDFVTYNFLSATGATIGSLSSLINGVPHRALSEFVTESPSQYSVLKTSPALTLKKLGYESRFIYGGNPGWRDINKYARLQGFDYIDGDVEIAKQIKIKDRHDWGLYDEDVFLYVEKILHEAQSPQFLLIMTTTNHPPYDLPKNYKIPTDLVAPLELSSKWTQANIAQKRLQTLRYSNDSIGHFLTYIKSSTQLKNNVNVALTGDHTYWLAPSLASEYLLNNSVPLYLYSPTREYPESNIFASHQDILPTLYDLTGVQFTFSSFGRSLYQPSPFRYAFNHSNLIFSEDGATLILNATTFSSLCWNDQSYFHLIECSATEAHQNMFKYYKSLMGSLDLFFKEQLPKTNTNEGQQ